MSAVSASRWEKQVAISGISVLKTVIFSPSGTSPVGEKSSIPASMARRQHSFSGISSVRAILVSLEKDIVFDIPFDRLMKG